MIILNWLSTRVPEDNGRPWPASGPVAGKTPDELQGFRQQLQAMFERHAGSVADAAEVIGTPPTLHAEAVACSLVSSLFLITNVCMRMCSNHIQP